MKRTLFLLSAVALVCSFMILPAFASESYSVSFVECSINTVSDFLLPNGTYVASIYDGSGTIRFTSEPFEFTGRSMSYSLLDGDTLVYELWIDLRPEDEQTAFEVYQVNDDYFNVWSDDRCVVFTLVLDEPVASQPSNGFLADVGLFFSSAVAWLANISSFIITRPVFLVLLAMPVIGFAVGLFARIKHL